MSDQDRFKELAVIWFKRAEEDLLWVKYDFKGKYYSQVCFGCQQIAEKSLKAFLFSCKKKLVRTHNLLKLLRLCRLEEPSFKKLFSNCEVLNAYYTDTRYPDIWDYGRFNKKKLASEAIPLAGQILEFVRERLKNF